MHRASSPRLLFPLGIAVALAPLSCTKSGEDEAPKTEAKADAPVEATLDPSAIPDEVKTKVEKVAEPTDGMTKVIAQGVSDATSGSGRLDRGDALGHFVLPNPSKLLEEVRVKAAPAKAAGFLTESTIRSLGGMSLGSRAGLLEHLVFDQPMGCVVLDDTSTDAPLACAVGYTGGAAAVVTDLGAEGKQPDAEGHVAHYRLEGEDLYLDDLEGHVVVTNHPAVFAKAKDYLVGTMIGRAPSITDDVEVVLYPNAAMSRYSKQIDSLFSLARSAPKPPPSGNAFVDAMSAYSQTSMDRGLDYYRDIDQFHMGFGLDEVGFVFRFALFPVPGSSAQSDTQAVAAGPVDVSMVEQLPAESWLISASTVDWKAAWDLESAASMRDVMIDAYATAVGREPAAVRTSVEAFLEENAALYDDDTAVAIAHLPGTQGGLVISRKLASPARDRWLPWTESFSPEEILGPEGVKMVTWSFQAGAMEVDGVAVDRWTIEPGPEAKAKIAAEKDPVVAEIETRFGGLKLVIDRVELSDRVLFVVAPGSEEKYVRSAIAATKGGGAGSDAGMKMVLGRSSGASVVLAADVAGALSWAREVMPAEATREIPPGLGENLSDFFFTATYDGSGAQHGEMVLSQAMIEQLKRLAG